MADFIILATADWDHPLWTNKQHTAQSLVEAGHRVLYVESLGIRAPRMGSADRTRIVRRLRRMLQLPRRRLNGLWVWSPPVLPGGHSGIVLQINRCLLKVGLWLATHWLRFKRPILWTYNPLTTLYLDLNRFAASVYHCVDRIQDQPGMPQTRIEVNEQRLAQRVNVLFTTSPELQSTHLRWHPGARMFGNVADHRHFSQALQPLPCPSAMRQTPHPRLLFMGAIDAYKLDLHLLHQLILRHPEWTFVLIGPVGECDPSTDVAPLKACSNVHLVGPQGYNTLPAWLSNGDVALLPLQLNGYTRNMFPMKFFEYLSAGLPVVATAIPALAAHGDVAWLCEPQVEAFEKCISEALAGHGPTLDQRVARARIQTYQVRTGAMLDVLQEKGLLKSDGQQAAGQVPGS